jgi:hypothetical protein
MSTETQDKVAPDYSFFPPITREGHLPGKEGPGPIVRFLDWFYPETDVDTSDIGEGLDKWKRWVKEKHESAQAEVENEPTESDSIIVELPGKGAEESRRSASRIRKYNAPPEHRPFVYREGRVVIELTPEAPYVERQPDEFDLTEPVEAETAEEFHARLRSRLERIVALATRDLEQAQQMIQQGLQEEGRGPAEEGSQKG